MPQKPRYSADQSLLASKAAQMRKAAAEDTGDTTTETGMAMDTAMPAMPAMPAPPTPAGLGDTAAPAAPAEDTAAAVGPMTGTPSTWEDPNAPDELYEQYPSGAVAVMNERTGQRFEFPPQGFMANMIGSAIEEGQMNLVVTEDVPDEPVEFDASDLPGVGFVPKTVPGTDVYGNPMQPGSWAESQLKSRREPRLMKPPPTSTLPTEQVFTSEGDPYEYAVESVEDLPGARGVKARLKGTGDWTVVPEGTDAYKSILSRYELEMGEAPPESVVPLPNLPQSPVPTSQPLPLPPMGGGFEYPERDAMKAIVREALNEAAAENAQK